MLAPANFGSPLAHKGRAFYGRFVKGFVAKREGRAFETGTHILKGLELASPYSWDLAMRDRFVRGLGMYAEGRVLCTVLVGNAGYGGIQAIANEDGSDGTVRTSTANLNCVKVRARFPANPDRVGHDVDYRVTFSAGRTAFGIVNGFNHSSVTLKQLARKGKLSDAEKNHLGDIVKGLTVTDAGFAAWCRKLDNRNRSLLPATPARDASKHGFQNTVVRVEDQYGVGVRDFLVEFYEKDDDKGRIAKMFHTSAIRKVHKYVDDPSYRAFYVDCTRLKKTIDKIGEHLSVSLTAFPEIDERNPVGFTTLGNDGIGGMRIPREQIESFFVPHRTALVTLELTRQQSGRLFRFRRP
jgi:hypothetical protein